MLHLLPIRKLIGTLVSLNTLVLIYTVYWLNPTSSTLQIGKYLNISVSILDIITLLISVSLWRWLWRRIPVLSTLYFPDLNGIWEGRIVFDEKSQEKGLRAKVRIRQNLLSIDIDLCSTTSKSHTLVAYPTVEAGNYKVYYVFHNTPQKPKYPEYKGTSLLTVNFESSPMRISGQYFTIRQTKGVIELKQTSTNPNEDYELY